MRQCYQCGTVEVDPVMGTVDAMRECYMCERPVCERCGSNDYDPDQGWSIICEERCKAPLPRAEERFMEREQ